MISSVKCTVFGTLTICQLCSQYAGLLMISCAACTLSLLVTSCTTTQIFLITNVWSYEDVYR